MQDSASANQSPPACAATPVIGSVVRAGPFTGPVSREHDVVDGRFRLRVGKYRDRESGLTQKIPWFVRRSARVGKSLSITGTRLGSDPQTFTLRSGRRPDGVKRYVFPSIVSPPAEGCWRLRFSSGKSTGRLTVLIQNDDAP